jgi:hypothetical protein
MARKPAGEAAQPTNVQNKADASWLVRRARDLRVVAVAVAALAAAVLAWTNVFAPKQTRAPNSTTPAASTVSATNGSVAAGGNISGSIVVPVTRSTSTNGGVASAAFVNNGVISGSAVANGGNATYNGDSPRGRH